MIREWIINYFIIVIIIVIVITMFVVIVTLNSDIFIVILYVIINVIVITKNCHRTCSINHFICYSSYFTTDVAAGAAIAFLFPLASLPCFRRRGRGRHGRGGGGRGASACVNLQRLAARPTGGSSG